ncbi:hypothetical protein NEF87_003813 [Candidatus Lokiarchaeum ossiferum]|uniref:Integron-associated effector binding protein domain-containing protein n=1 Tax=Candidatus Lokiarchaeum ossiferum TaxID=2951803 RepID=A0ABY6HVH9_9ARCH|nr:hypothetical protein NEF87_003813 [Candidatus Lokiarchaeum sp. B-35]
MKQQKLSSFIDQKSPPMNMIQLPSMMVIGMEIVFEHKIFPEYQASRQLWQTFNHRLQQIPNRKKTKGWEKWGILYHQFDETQQKILKYMACVEVSDLKFQIASMVGLQIPSLHCQKHIHRGALIHLPETLDHITQQKRQKNIEPEPLLPPPPLIIDHLEHYDHRFHWSKPSSEIRLYIPER